MIEHEAIDKAIQHLTDVKTHLSELDKVKAKIAIETGRLSSLKGEIASSKVELDSTKDALTKHKGISEKQFSQEKEARISELRVLTEQVVAKRAELVEMESKVNKLQGLHKQIEDSIQSMKKRFL